jgi:hypothetical protein
MAMVSPWMAKGTALEFVIANPTANKLELVLDNISSYPDFY